MIFMKIISWKSEKENHNLKQGKISNESLTMWKEHYRIPVTKKKGNQNLRRQNRKYSARNYVLESICTCPYQLCTSGCWVSICALFFFSPNCSNSISATVLHANRRIYNGDKLNLKKTALTNNHSKTPWASNRPELANGCDRSMDYTGSCLPNMITLFSERWAKARVNRQW